MSVDLIKAPTHDAPMEQPAQKHRVLRFVEFAGSFAVGAVAAVTIGSSLGHNMQDHNLREDQRFVAGDRTSIVSDTAQLNTAMKRSGAFLTALSPACANVVKIFLPGGKNAKLKEYNAETEVQNTRLCPAGDVTLIADARAVNHIIIDRRAQLSADNEALSSDLAQEKDDHNKSITSVAGQVEGIAFIGGTLAGLVLSELGVATAQHFRPQPSE